MSYEDNENEYANGANGRFDGLDRRFKQGGNPRRLEEPKAQEVTESLSTIGKYFRGDGLNAQLMNSNGELTSPMPTVDMMREFKAIRDAKDAADLLAKELGRVHDYMRLVLVPERFEQDGIKNIKVDGVGRVQLAGDLYAGIIKGHEDEAFEFLSDNGRGDLVKKTVHPSSLKAVLKKMMETGEEFPGEVFKAEPFTRASIVKV